MTTIIIIFSIVYLGMILGRFPYLKVNRAAIAMIGAVALLSGHLITPSKAIASIDFKTLALLFGLMIISIQFDMCGLYTAISSWVRKIKVSPAIFLALVTILVGGLSALLTNDVVAVAITPVILSICIDRKLNPIPFMLAIAFATNSGAIATFVGSPQNMLIAEKLNLSFISFLAYTGIPSIISLTLGWAVLVWIYRDSWSLNLSDSSGCTRMKLAEVPFMLPEAVKGVIIIAVVIGYFMFTNDDRGIIAITAGAFLLMNAHYKSQEMIEKVDWNLLILFFGLFIVNAAMDATGIPKDIVNALSKQGFDLSEPPVLFIVTALLSDIVSNVPSVMLLLPYVTDPISGPLMAIASGLSSNMIIIGSLANIIVVDAAASKGLKISFWEFAKSGIPVSIISMIIGAGWVYLIDMMLR